MSIRYRECPLIVIHSLKADATFDFVADIILICSLLCWNREMNASTAIVSTLGSILGIAGIG